jgi:hypothetical protein
MYIESEPIVPLEVGKIYRDNVSRNIFTPTKKTSDWYNQWEILALSGPNAGKKLQFDPNLGQDYKYVEDYGLKHKLMVFLGIKFTKTY